MSAAEAVLGLFALIMGGGNIWNWLSNRGKQRVDLIALAEKIAAATITALDTRIKELEAKVDALSAHVETLEGVIRELGATPPPRPGRKAG